jgi:hypothetical protein
VGAEGGETPRVEDLVAAQAADPPWTDAKPVVEEGAVAEPDPAFAQEAAAQPEAVLEESMGREQEPVVAAEEAAEPQPTFTEEEAAEPQPTFTEEEAVEAEPVVAEEAVAEPEPVVAEEAVAEPEPVVAEEAVAEPEPVVAEDASMMPEQAPIEESPIEEAPVEEAPEEEELQGVVADVLAEQPSAADDPTEAVQAAEQVAKENAEVLDEFTQPTVAEPAMQEAMEEPPVKEQVTTEQERPVYEEAANETPPPADEPVASAYASPDVDTVQEDGITEEAGGSVFQDDNAINDVPMPQEEAVQASEQEIAVDLPPEQAMPEEVEQLPAEGTHVRLVQISCRGPPPLAPRRIYNCTDGAEVCGGRYDGGGDGPGGAGPRAGSRGCGGLHPHRLGRAGMASPLCADSNLPSPVRAAFAPAAGLVRVCVGLGRSCPLASSCCTAATPKRTKAWVALFCLRR